MKISQINEIPDGELKAALNELASCFYASLSNEWEWSFIEGCTLSSLGREKANALITALHSLPNAR